MSLLTLRDAARRAGISVPTARKYLAREPDRIPSSGKGRRRRYPAEAVAAFVQLRVEGDARHGRPRSDGSPIRRSRT